MQILGFISGLKNQNSWGMGQGDLYFNNLSRWFWSRLKLETWRLTRVEQWFTNCTKPLTHLGAQISQCPGCIPQTSHNLCGGHGHYMFSSSLASSSVHPGLGWRESLWVTLEDSAPPQAIPAGLAGGVRKWGGVGVQIVEWEHASLYCHARFLIPSTFPFEADIHKMWAWNSGVPWETF